MVRSQWSDQRRKIAAKKAQLRIETVDLYPDWTTYELRCTLKRRRLLVQRNDDYRSADRKKDEPISHLKDKQALIAYLEAADKGGRHNSPYLDWTAKDLRYMISNHGDVDVDIKAKKIILAAALERADVAYGFPLLDLPAELRNRIYRFVFEQAYPTRRLQKRNDGPTYYPRHEMGLHYTRGPMGADIGHPLLAVSQQVRHESLPIYVSMKVFHIVRLGSDSPSHRLRLPMDESLFKSVRTFQKSFGHIYYVGHGEYYQPTLRVDLHVKEPGYEFTLLLRHLIPRRFHNSWRLRPPNFSKGGPEYHCPILHTALKQELDALCKNPGVGNFGRTEFEGLWKVVASVS